MSRKLRMTVEFEVEDENVFGGPTDEDMETMIDNLHFIARKAEMEGAYTQGTVGPDSDCQCDVYIVDDIIVRVEEVE